VMMAAFGYYQYKYNRARKADRKETI